MKIGKSEWPWWLLFLVAGGLLTLGYSLNTGHFILALLLALAPLLPGMALMGWLDRCPPTALHHGFRSFGWGLLVIPLVASHTHVMVAVMIEGAFERNGPFNPEQGAIFGSLAGSVLSAPVVEESLKALLPLACLCWSRSLSGPWPALFLGGLSALGFGLFENATQFASSAKGMGELFQTRALFPYLHFLFSLPLLLAIGFAVCLQTLSRRLALLLAGWLTSVVFHALWNWEVLLGGSDFSVFAPIQHAVILSPLLIVATLLMVFEWERRALARSGHSVPGILHLPRRRDDLKITEARKAQWAEVLETPSDSVREFPQTVPSTPSRPA